MTSKGTCPDGLLSPIAQPVRSGLRQVEGGGITGTTKRTSGLTLSNGRMWKPNRQELAHVQDITALALGMPRGSTTEQRKGAPARKHIPHQVYRRMKEDEALSPALENLRQQNQSLSTTAEVANIQTKVARMAKAMGVNPQRQLPREVP